MFVDEVPCDGDFCIADFASRPTLPQTQAQEDEDNNDVVFTLVIPEGHKLPRGYLRMFTTLVGAFLQLVHIYCAKLSVTDATIAVNLNWDGKDFE